MKKVFAMALALVMMFAACVPAFAADVVLNKTTTTTNAPIIKTSTQNELGEDADHFTVTISAETVFPWGKVDNTVNYQIDAQLMTGKGLRVTASGNAGVMSNTDDAETIAYTLTDNATFATGAAVFSGGVALGVNITDAAWAAVPVNEYQDTLTFTAEIVDL